MNLSDIQYRTTSTSSLSFGSTFNEDDLMFYTNGTGSINFPFGKLDKDVLKFSVYDLDNTLISSSMVYAGGTYTPFTKSYTDVNTRQVTYNYTTYTSNWTFVGGETSSLFIDMSKQMNALGLTDGNYVVTVELMRNMVGSEKSSSDKLLINAVSSNRDEIALIPKTSAGSNSAIEVDMNIFGNDQFKVKEVAQDLLDSISSPQIYNIYFSAAKLDPTGSNALKFYYGFTSRGSGSAADFDVVSWLTDVYYGVSKGNLRADGTYAPYDILGIYDQFKNWLYSNYEAGATFQDIKDYYYSLFRYVIDVELNHITNKKPENYDLVIEFLQKIYYDAIFFSKEAQIETDYINDLSGYFKNYLNFNDGSSYSILNKKLVQSTDPRFNNILVLKLDRPLSLDLGLNSDAWITNNFGFQPIVQNLYYYTLPVYNTVKLRGPNFLVRVESQGNSTEAVSMEELIEETGSLYDELVSKLGARASGTIDNTDYRYFENFVNFSSATMRVAAFDWKYQQINTLKSEIAELDLKLISNPTDEFYATERSDANKQIDEIESSMDGYERFLYNNSMWRESHAFSASLYDKENGNSLVNGLPQFIIEDANNNADYITFVGMIGHFFDNLSIAVKQITEKNNYSSSPSYGISLDVVYDMLLSLGWEAEISKDNLPLLLASFSKQDFDPDSELYNSARSFSEEERNQVIWKRLLNSLPYLYKTKGTEAGLNALISCFGIPRNIVKIKEFGGIHNKQNLQDSTLYVLDEVKYEPYFSGSGEYFKINWTGSAQTIEFTFAFDKNKTSTFGEVFRLVNCSGSWVMGAYRDKGLDWGRVFFSLDDGSGNTNTVMTGKAPIFDGSTYHVMVRRNDPTPSYNLSGSVDSVVDAHPIRYDLLVQKAQDSRITFAASASYFFSGSYNQNFRSGSFLYIGNYQQNTASLNIDPEAFFGNIDEIKVWEAPVDDERFTNHTLHQNAYDLDSPQQMVSENLFRASFERPVELYDSGSGVVTLNNLSFRSDFPTFEAVNFPRTIYTLQRVTECDPTTGSQFPYQFTRKDTRQTVKLPDYGAGRFRSNKINYVRQELVSNLSPTQRASMQASELVSVGTNRLGVFFSPTEAQNMEIIKFFGDYPLTDLIGDPSAIYESSYKKFEKFKQIFYEQGFGAVDYQFFMNIVRFYFDKAMLKYIRGMVPARAKLVDGILIEPSILERPKIAMKPLVQEVVPQNVGVVDGVSKLNITSLPRLTASVDMRNTGTAIFDDVNRVFFPAIDNSLGFGILADSNGLTYYKGDYYRADVLTSQKSYQVYNRYNLDASSSVSAYQRDTNLNGTVQTVSSSYQKVNIASMPNTDRYPFTMSFYYNATDNSARPFYLSGSVDFLVATQGTGLAYQLMVSHSFYGFVTGSISGRDPRIGSTPAQYQLGIIRSNGFYITGSAVMNSGSSVVFLGDFSTGSAGQQLFNGIVYYQNAGSPVPVSARYHATIISTDFSSSIFDMFRTNMEPTTSSLFGSLLGGLNYRKELSMQYYPANQTLLTGYFPTHYKYTRQQFSQKVINSYDQTNSPVKWKRGSQTKKTTVDPTSGLFDGSDPVVSKTI